ncbi:hypothetical protein ACFXDP_13495 [Streptomyces sp. NPDC059374]|uniref:DUF6414 family protein n=1 Tax=Streptomyces sp. NPDC059374 TaxID=3346814 RepID=UPI003674807E
MKVLRRRLHELKRLREFIYLDEVSVTSLLASILGAIPSEITEKLTNSTRSETSGGGEYKLASGKVNAGKKREVTRTSDYQVLRKASIQATFKDLYASVESSLLVRSGHLPELKPAVRRRIRNASPGGVEIAPWIFNSAVLKRGQLLELEVELRADAIFRTSTIISSMTNIIGQSPALAAEIDTQEMRTAIEINGFIEELMAGLIPIKCQVLDYEISSITGHDYIVHSSLFSELPLIYRRNRKPLHLVGVVEEALFWKDIRRVLFSSSPVKVLCRVGRDRVQDSWSPVKLVDVLKEVIPDMESAMDDFGPSALRALTGGVDDNRDVSQLREAALIRYGELLVDSQGLTMPADLRSRIAEIASTRSSQLGSVTANRIVFGEVAECVSNGISRQFAPGDLAGLRGQAMSQFGLMVDGSLSVRPENSSGRLDEVVEGKFIDAEIVAIYW